MSAGVCPLKLVLQSLKLLVPFFATLAEFLSGLSGKKLAAQSLKLELNPEVALLSALSGIS